jgi:sporulation protein YlmC with PRC-barrel domain
MRCMAQERTLEEDMLAKHLALALLSTTLMAAPALAQTNQPAGSTTAPAAGSTTAPSAQMGTGTWMTQEQPGQWRASKLEGLNVYNQNNEKIGDISELIVDSSGKIQAVVIGVGGFLGMGERDVAVPMDQIKFVNEPLAVATTTTTDGRTVAPAPNAPATATTPATPGTVSPNATVTVPAAPGTVNPDAPATTGTVAPSRTADATNRSAPDHAVLMANMTKDQLKAAPEFKYAR